MLLTIHNLPSNTRYVDVKSMLHEKCGLTELILDNLISEGNTKQVTVGLADEGDAGILVRKINGLYINGLQLYVEDKRKKKDSDQPYRSSASLVQNATNQESVGLREPMGNMPANMNPAMMMNYNMGSMYMPMQMMPMDQNMSYMGYSGFVAMPPVEPGSLALGNDRDFGGYQGDYGGPRGPPRELPRDVPRPHEQPRDMPRPHEPPRDMPRPHQPARDRPRPHEPPRDVPRPHEPPRNVPRPHDPPRDRPRPHEPARDAQRPRDWKRRASPERPAEVFNRPNRWNDSSDVPMRREPSPPRQQWPAREAPPERPRNFDEFQPRPEHRHTDPEWQPRASRWDHERHPPRAQPEPEPAPHWQPEPEPQWEPEPERPWEPEPERAWNEPAHTMQNDNQQFNNWEGDFPSGTEGNYPRPEQFEPYSQDFDEGYPQAQREPESHERPRDRSAGRDRRHRGDDWNAGVNDRRDKNIRNDANRDEQAWNRHEEPHRPNRPSRPTNRDPKPSSSNRKEWRDEQRPNPPKRPLPDRQQGPADWKQIANDYPPSKKPKVFYEKPTAAPKRNLVKAKPPVANPKPIQKPERKPITQSSLSNYKENRVTNIINKDQTSRGQATAAIYKYILGKVTGTRLNKIHPGIVKELRTCIRSRIDVMLGEELTSRQAEVIQRYRKMYPTNTDKELYRCMEEKVLKAQKETEAATGENKVVVKTEKTDEVKVKTEDKNENGKQPKADKEKTDKEKPKLPRHAMTDKQIVSEAKKQRKVEFSKKDHYKMDPITEKVAGEELVKISAIFASQCANPVDNIDKAICDRITKDSVDEFEQTARLHLAKRILDIRTGLAVRIYAAGKLPRRVFVQEYLKPYRIERLVLKKNKQGTMYVANIGNFEQYDHLCKIENDVIDGTPVSIRSMYLVGPPPKLSRNQIKARREQFINSQIKPREGYIVPADNDTVSNNETEPMIKAASPVKPDAEDTTLDMNAESMEDFRAEDFDGAEFNTEDFAEDPILDNFADDPNLDNFADDPHFDDNLAEDPKVDDVDNPEGLNIADIKDEDLEDF